MRKFVLLSLAAAAVAVPAAFAAPGGNPAKPDKPAPTLQKTAKVAFVVKGVVTSLNATDASLTIKLDVKGGNAHARRALKGLSSFVVKTNEKTSWSFGQGQVRMFTSAKANDRVVVRYVARKNADAAALGALFARKVTDQGPKPAA
jgi:hypothetical protein